MDRILGFTLLLFYILIFFSPLLGDPGGERLPMQRYIVPLAGVLLLTQIGRLVPILLKGSLYWLYLAYVLISFFWASAPNEVLQTNRYQLATAAAAVCGALAFSGREKELIRGAIFFLGAVVALSIVWVVLNLDGAFATFDARRWAGVTSHPNDLGQAAMMVVWASIANLYYQRKSYDMWLSSVVLILAIVTLVGSDSKTSVASAIFGAVIIVLTVRRESIRFTYLLMGTGLYMALVVVMSLFVTNALVSMTDVATNLLGRDVTLTGRTELWAEAFKFFFERPLLGWGYDTLGAITDKFSLLLKQHGFVGRHLHNAYLDILLRGGVIGLVLFVGVVISLISRIHRLAHDNPRLSVLLLASVLMLLVHGIAEGGLGKGLNASWLSFSLIYFLVAAKVASVDALTVKEALLRSCTDCSNSRGLAQTVSEPPAKTSRTLSVGRYLELNAATGGFNRSGKLLDNPRR